MGPAEEGDDVSNRTDQPAQQDASGRPQRPGRTGSRAWLHRPRTWVLAGAAVVVVGGYATAALALGGSAPRGTTVLGVDVGGMDRTRIADALGGPAAEAGARAVPVRVAGAGPGVDSSLDPTGALAVDVDATAADLTAAAWAPATLWKHVTGGGPTRPEVTVDDAALATALQPVAQSVDAPAVEGAVTFAVTPGVDGAAATVTPVTADPADGRTLDLDGAADRVAAAWPTTEPVELLAEVARPTLSAEEVAASVDDLAVPAVTGDLTVAGGDRRAVLAPAAFAPALAVRPVDGEPALVADGEALEAAVLAADPAFEAGAQDARIEVVDAVPRVVPAVQGTAVDPADLATAVVAALSPASAPAAPGSSAPTPGAPTSAAPQGDRTAQVTLVTSTPAVTTEALQGLGIVEQISTFATTLTPDRDRTDNIRIATRYLNGTVVQPGAEFSLNDTIGERTPERGFHRAPVISGGKLVDDYGGGVSQVSTTLFNNVFFSGVDELEHKPHSLYISRYPEGREATLDWRSIDNRFRNDSGHGIYIEAGIVGNQVVVSFYGTKFMDVTAQKGPRTNVTTPRTIYDTSASCTSQTPHGGFTTTVTRVMTPVGGGAEQRETWRTVYNVGNRVVCGPDPAAATPTPTPTAPAPTTPAPPVG